MLFIVTKITLLACGYIATVVYQPINDQLPPTPFFTGYAAGKKAVSSHTSIAMWFNWDAFHYETLAKSSYWEPVPQAVKDEIKRKQPATGGNILRFSWVPLYPLASKVVGKLLDGHYPIAMLLVTNAAFLGILFNAYRLGRLWFGSDEAAERFVKYLVLMPAAFLLQSAMSEPVFLFMLITSTYYAFKEKWVLAGAFGFLAALSHAPGFLVCVPLFLILLQKQNYRFGRTQLVYYVKNVPWLVLPPLGWLLFVIYSWVMTGDIFAYSHIVAANWGVQHDNPLWVLWAGTHQPAFVAIRAWMTILMLLVIVASYRIVKLPLVVYSLAFAGIALVPGPDVSFASILRYTVVLFPLALVFAQWAKNKDFDTYLTLGLGILQGLLFVTWITYRATFII